MSPEAKKLDKPGEFGKWDIVSVPKVVGLLESLVNAAEQARGEKVELKGFIVDRDCIHPLIRRGPGGFLAFGGREFDYLYDAELIEDESGISEPKLRVKWVKRNGRKKTVVYPVLGAPALTGSRALCSSLILPSDNWDSSWRKSRVVLFPEEIMGKPLKERLESFGFIACFGPLLEGLQRAAGVIK